jgi:hypothetical protein
VKNFANLAPPRKGSESFVRCLRTQLSTFKDAREKLTVDLESSRTRCDWYHQGYHYQKAKTVRYLAELSFVPWLRDLLWSHKFHWGFENYRYLLINRACYNINLATVGSDYLSTPIVAIDKMVDSGRELILDDSEVNPYGFWPTPTLPLEPAGPEIDPSDDEDVVVVGPSSYEEALLINFLLLYMEH